MNLFKKSIAWRLTRSAPFAIRLGTGAQIRLCAAALCLGASVSVQVSEGNADSPSIGIPSASPLNVPPAAGSEQSSFEWKTIEPGLAVGRYRLGTPSAMIHNEVFLLKVNPSLFSFHALSPMDVPAGKRPPASATAGTDPSRTDVRSLALSSDAVAAINANFFDENGEPLGLRIERSTQLRKMHRGGNVLTGVFFIRDRVPGIVTRETFDPKNVSVAVQAGPRLIVNRAPVKVEAAGTSRRSGIAITGTQEVILFATVLRFPGATFSDIQQMLRDPRLDVVNALNLDGGGSSQLFVKRLGKLEEEVYITGGDVVPVGLVVRREAVRK